MRIVLDLQACQSGSRLGGIGRYSLALAKSIAKHASSHDVFVLLSEAFETHRYEIELEFANSVPAENIVSFPSCGSVSASSPDNLARKRVGEIIRDDFIQRLSPDILHVSSLVEGFGDDVVTSIEANSMARRTAVTWYDLIPYVQPDMYLRDATIAAHYFEKIDEVRKAASLLAISQFTADEAVELLGFDKDRVYNISAGVDSRFCPSEIRPLDRLELESRFGIEKPFLLYTGSFDARKNQRNLIRAFGLLPESLRREYQLVICGNGWDGVYNQLREVASASGVAPESLIFTGHVTDDELLTLYRAAKLFVFPSLREGCGLPALEAMACGTPAIGSNTTSLPEVIGRKDALFDPRSAESIAGKIHEVLENTYFHEVLLQHGLQHVKNFTWDNGARVALEAFEQIHDDNQKAVGGQHPAKLSAQNQYELLIDKVSDVGVRTHLTDHDLNVISLAIQQCCDQSENNLASKYRASRCGWITPWGTRCGIASYAQYLVEASDPVPSVILAEKKAATKAMPGMDCIPCWTAGDDQLEELGSRVEELDLDSLVIQFNFGFFDFAALSRFLKIQAAKRRRVVMILHSTVDPPPEYNKKLAELVPYLSLCTKVLVHTERDVKRLQEIGLTKNVAIIRHAIPDVSLKPSSRKENVREARDGFAIGTYGFFLPHKGLLETIEAVASLADTSIKLNMVNSEYSQDASAELIRQAHTLVDKHGMQSRVSICTDYLTDSDSVARLRQCDLILYPYQNTGESSSAAVRLGIASGRPVAVTPLAIFDDVSDVVYRLQGTSVEMIARSISEIKQRLQTGHDKEFDALADRASSWRSKHSVKRIAHQLCQIVNKPDVYARAA